MANLERETIILLNEADMADGFFYFFTSRKSDALKIKRRLKNGHILNTEVTTRDNKETYWEFKIDKNCLGSNFAIRKPGRKPTVGVQEHIKRKLRKTT